MTNQGELQAALRSVTGQAYDYNGDWHAYFDYLGIASGSFNERMIIWLQQILNSSKTNLQDLKAEYAATLGLDSWNSVTSVIPYINGLTLWLDASDSTTLTLTGSDVDLWADKSGNGNNATKATNAPQSGVNTLNGKNVISFSTNQYFTLPSELYDLPSAANTVFIVARTTDATTEQYLLSMTSSGAKRLNLYYGNDGDSLRYQSNTSGSPRTLSGVNTLSYGTCFGARLSLSQFVDYKGANGYTDLNPFAATSSDTDAATIGAYADGTTGFLEGDIAEILVFNRKLSTAECIAVDVYLANKWGVYSPYANWYDSYTDDQQSIISALRLNKDDAFLDVASNPITTWFNAGLDTLGALEYVNDFSGKDHFTATQATTTARATNTADVINGENSMIFDGGDQYIYRSTDNLDIRNVDYEMMVVARKDSGNTVENALISGPVDNYELTVSGSQAVKYTPNTGLTVTIGSASDYLGVYKLYGARTENDTGIVSVNTTDSSPTASGARNNNIVTMSFARRSAGGLYLSGGVAEAFIFTKALKAAERADMRTYLINKYNLT